MNLNLSNVAVGVNTLDTMMPKISVKGELATIYTNHSLRATSTSRMFACNVPEKVIQEKTGHRSLAGLRAYERTTTKQEQVVAKILETGECSENSGETGKSSFSESSKENEIPTLTPSSTSANPSNLFTGQLQNCGFNFYAK